MSEEASNAETTIELPDTTGEFTVSMGLLSRLKAPKAKIDFVPVLDMVIVALLISLLFTRFVSMPGVRLDLPSTELKMQHDAGSIAVLTLGNNGMIIFDGSVYEVGTIARAFQRHVEDSLSDQPVLLVKAEANLDFQFFLDLCEMAQAAGFTQIQVAGKAVEEVNTLIPGEQSFEGDFFRPSVL
ncbi:MAG: biopolymer transporter ExbD [Verrucomicrobiota bacterium]